MTKEDFEILIAGKPPETKARGAVLFNAVNATLQAYNSDPHRSRSLLDNNRAAQAALDEFVASLGGGATADSFDNLFSVLAYLQGKGWKIKKSNLYQHRKDGKILPGDDGAFTLAAVDRYAKTFLKRMDTGKRITEASDDVQRKIASQQERINDLRIRREERREAMEEKRIVAAQVVLDASFAICRNVRDAMQNIPDRITEIVAAETDPVKVREILTTEIHQSLEGLDKLESILER